MLSLPLSPCSCCRAKDNRYQLDTCTNPLLQDTTTAADTSSNAIATDFCPQPPSVAIDDQYSSAPSGSLDDAGVYVAERLLQLSSEFDVYDFSLRYQVGVGEREKEGGREGEKERGMEGGREGGRREGREGGRRERGTRTEWERIQCISSYNVYTYTCTFIFSLFSLYSHPRLVLSSTQQAPLTPPAAVRTALNKPVPSSLTS